MERCLSLVKLLYRLVKRKYKRDTYVSPECRLSFPVKLHETTRFLFNRKVKLEVKREGDTVVIIIREDLDP
jgi:hypothetical protein